MSNIEAIDYLEWLDLCRQLEKHHPLFECLWKIGRPVFTDKIQTAGVVFDRIGETIDFKLNPNFWKTLSDKQKQFVLSHEMLHILSHGLRISQLSDEEKQIANKCLDVVVNFALVDRFGFNRKEIDPNNIYCWVDTVFPKNTPKPDEYFEYYYNLLEKQQAGNSGSGKGKGGGSNQKNQNKGEGSGKGNQSGQLVDDHSELDSFNNQDFEKKVQEITKNVDMGSLPEFVKDQTQDIQQLGQQAGISPGTAFKQMKIEFIAKKKRWEEIIKNWSKKAIKDKEQENWVKVNRRFATIQSDLMLPTDVEVDAFERDRIEVFFFLIQLGYSERFWKAAKSLPKEKFDIKLFCFDTYPTSLESGKLYGFGGTAFQPMENYIQRYMAEKNKSYPQGIFVISDGWGTPINPEFPARWHWIMTPHHDLHYVPKESKHYNLTEFE